MYLFINNLGENNTEDIKWLGEGMKFLSNKLQKFEFYLSGNKKMGNNTENIKFLGNGI